MGWKNLKEHYRVQHIVHVVDGDICIGSPYISKIIIVSPDGVFKKRHTSGNNDLARIQSEMDADLSKLIEIIASPDHFEQTIPIFTFKNGEVREKHCEELGWPNVTHDGILMYDNTFFTSKGEAVKYAKKETAYGIKMYRRLIDEKKEELRKLQEQLAAEEAISNQLSLM